MPVPTAVPPCASLQQPRLHCREPCQPLLHLRAPARQLLSERHRHGIHQVRAPGLHDRGELLLAAVQRIAQLRERRHQLAAHEQRRAHVDRRRDAVVAALGHVDVIVRVHCAAQVPAGERGDHLVGIHVAAGARAGLKHIEGECRIVSAGRHFRRCRLHRRGNVRRQQTQPAVGARRSLFDQAEGADEGARQGLSADRKVIDRALGLRAPQRLCRHLQFTHAVVLHAVGSRHACTPLLETPGRIRCCVMM